jgi:hypothetical protein
MATASGFYKGHKIIILPVWDQKICSVRFDEVIEPVDSKHPMARMQVRLKRIGWYCLFVRVDIHITKLRHPGICGNFISLFDNQ